MDRARIPAARMRFLLTFVVMIGIELGAVVWLFGGNLDVSANGLTARAAAWVLRLLGSECRAEDNLIVCGSLSSLRIIFECTGVFPVGVFLAAVVAFPVRWGWKLVGAGLGVPAILAFNLMRILALVWIEGRLPSATEWAHVVVGQALMAVFVVVAWLAWATAARRRIEPARA